MPSKEHLSFPAVKNLPANAGRHRFDPWVGDPLKKALVTHSSTPAWETPWTDNFLAGYSPRVVKELDRTEPLTNSKKEHSEMDGWLKRKTGTAFKQHTT